MLNVNKCRTKRHNPYAIIALEEAKKRTNIGNRQMRESRKYMSLFY